MDVRAPPSKHDELTLTLDQAPRRGGPFLELAAPSLDEGDAKNAPRGQRRVTNARV